jgi:hypothetical protein
VPVERRRPRLSRRFHPQYFLTRTGVTQVNLSQPKRFYKS